MSVLIKVALVMAVFLTAGPATSHAGLVLYDSFNDFAIDPHKWSGFESESGGDTEIGRRLVLGSLRMNYVSYGGNTSDSGRPGGSQGLSARNPDAVTALQVDMTLLEATAQGCPANSLASRSRMQIVGDFFNDGSGDPMTGDRTGNYRAIIQKVLDSTEGRRIEAIIIRCLNASCSNQVTLMFDTFATTWTPFVKHTLRLEWEPWNSQFVFTVNPGRRQEQIVLPYSVEEVVPAVFPFKNISLSTSMPNCTAGRKKTSADGLFDNVMTNPLP